MQRFPALVFLAFGALCLPLQGQSVERYTKVATHLMELFNAADFAGIQKLYNPDMDKALPLDKSTEFYKGLTAQMGKMEKLEPPRPAGPAMVFPVKFENGHLDMQLALDRGDQIAGLYFRPHADAKPAPERHETRLSLPLKDRWLVVWGGDTSALNQHHDVPNQKFAFDLIGVDASGKTKRGEGKRNEDYLAFGREVLAPADGTVVTVIEGVPDCVPGSMNPFSALGNCVMIQHREDEVSVLAHFKRGSISVKTGDTIKRGQLLGQCGNSGNSSEPHIHYHLQNSPVIQDGLGIKCVFDKVAVAKDGKTQIRTNYSPVKSDIIGLP